MGIFGEKREFLRGKWEFFWEKILSPPQKGALSIPSSINELITFYFNSNLY